MCADAGWLFQEFINVFPVGCAQRNRIFLECFYGILYFCRPETLINVEPNAFATQILSQLYVCNAIAYYI